MMNNMYSSGETPQELTIEPPKKSLGVRIMDRWHSFASPPPLPANATVPQREEYRRARLVSAVVLFFFPLMVIGVPTALTMPNPYIFWVACSILVSLIVAPFFNRAGHVFTAGLLIVLSFEATVIFSTVTMTPLNETAFQLYDLFALVILLALAILPRRTIWVIAIIDCIFIIADLLYQPRTPEFTALLAHEGLPTILARPVALVLFLTSVCTFLLSNTTKAVRQSYEAEFIANIERAAAQQNEIEAEAKRELEESIQQIVQAHTDTMNGRTKERIPYPSAKVLWPLVGVVNTLWTRLQRSQQREQEFSQLQEEILMYNERVQHTIRFPNQPLPTYQTKSVLSLLSQSMARLHRETLDHSGRQMR